MVTRYSADDPLLSARFKLERADFHIKDLEGLLSDFLGEEPRPYRVVPELDPQFPSNTFRCIVRARPPRTWAGVAGDAATNLRASLDHLIFALSIHWLGGRVEPSRETAFVLTDKPTAFKGRAREALSHLPDTIWDEVEAFQPYHRHERPKLGVLYGLNELVNADKHRSIQPVYARLTATLGGERRVFPNFKDGDRVVIQMSPETYKNLDPREIIFSAAIGFPIGPLAGARTQMLTIGGLREAHDFIRDEVLPRFAVFFEQTPPTDPIVRERAKRRRRRRNGGHSSPPMAQ